MKTNPSAKRVYRVRCGLKVGAGLLAILLVGSVGIRAADRFSSVCEAKRLGSSLNYPAPMPPAGWVEFR